MNENKYSINDILFNRLLDKRQKGRKVIDIRNKDKYITYKFECKCKECKSGFVWTPEWMLYSESEFVAEIKSGQLLDLKNMLQ